MHRDRLSYDTWTSILPDKATPAQAETDMPLGKARIPKNWSLKLVTLPAIFPCMRHHDYCHLAVPKLCPSSLITKHHRIERIFWSWMADEHVLQVCGMLSLICQGLIETSPHIHMLKT